jgi:site-specific recombinase XerD
MENLKYPLSFIFPMKFTKLMKNELSGQKKEKRFSWALDEDKYLKIYEVKRLRNVWKKARDWALKQGKTTVVRDWFMIELGLNTGLRVEEMANLKCGDLLIKKERSSIIVRKGKGGKKRTVWINSDFKQACLWFLEWKSKTGQRIDDQAYLLTHKNSNQLTKRALQKAFKRCIKKATLPNHYSIHSLRHTYGTHLYIASGHNLRLVQQQLGHSSVRVTEVYASLIGSDVKKAIEKLYKK